MQRATQAMAAGARQDLNLVLCQYGGAMERRVAALLLTEIATVERAAFIAAVDTIAELRDDADPRAFTVTASALATVIIEELS